MLGLATNLTKSHSASNINLAKSKKYNLELQQNQYDSACDFFKWTVIPKMNDNIKYKINAVYAQSLHIVACI